MIDMDIHYLSSLIKLGLLDHANIYIGKTLYFEKVDVHRPFYVSWKRTFLNGEPDGGYYSGCWIRYD